MTVKVEQIDPYRWRIPRKGAMRTDGLVFASAKMMQDLHCEQALEQVCNVATLPGIIGSSMAMPDIHWGYGFPIGGVAAFDVDEGVISPGGVGYDINCGVRLLRSDLVADEIRPISPDWPMRSSLMSLLGLDLIAVISNSLSMRRSEYSSKVRPGRCSRDSVTQPTLNVSRDMV